MFGSNTLESAVGLALFFLLASLLCSGIREGLETVMKSRARDLERGLRALLDDRDGTVMMPALLGHGLLASLSDGEYNPNMLRKSMFGRILHLPVGQRAGFPSYIPANQFASALLDIVSRGPGDSRNPLPTAPASAANVRAAVRQLPGTRLQQVVLPALDMAGDDLDKARRELERWFDGSMDRVSGWYKRRTQIVLFFIGFGAALLLNLDALTVAARLDRDNGLRNAALAAAERLPRAGPGEAGNAVRADARLSSLGYPIGWKRSSNGLPVPGPQTCPDPGAPCSAGSLTAGTAAEILVGWLITALAVTLGAPFWFDLLNRFMVIRSTVKPAQKSPNEASADPQPRDAADALGEVQADQPTARPIPPAATPAAAPLRPWDPDLPTWRLGFDNPREIAL